MATRHHGYGTGKVGRRPCRPQQLHQIDDLRSGWSISSKLQKRVDRLVRSLHLGRDLSMAAGDRFASTRVRFDRVVEVVDDPGDVEADMGVRSLEHGARVFGEPNVILEVLEVVLSRYRSGFLHGRPDP
jgi:hypothetical protein